MIKKRIALLMVLILTLSSLTAPSLAAAKQMEDGVPVWTEATVRDYALKYVHSEDMDTLWGYYDLQIRRYMPMETYTTMLTEIEWMTGRFIQLGSYRSFQEPEQKTKTHVLHLCMEKQDLDMYFTHKDKEDDWEVMAIEFVPADNQNISLGTLVTENDEDVSMQSYTELEVTVGKAPYELKGILMMPEGASASAPVPACVLVHGSGPSDMDETVGQTKFFADLAQEFARKGIATLRYDKRTYTYGAAMTEEEINNITVKEETIEDAISAGQLLQENEWIDSQKIVLVGHSMGAMLAPRIATEADGIFSAMLLIAGTPHTLLEIIVQQSLPEIEKLDEAQQAAFNEQLLPLMAQLSQMKEEEARGLTFFGVNAYYFWEMEQHDPVKLIKNLKLPTYIVQGNNDFQVPVEYGVEAYEDALGENIDYIDYKVFRDLNHLLMKYTGPVESQNSLAEYDTPANVDAQAAQDMAAWIQSLWPAEVENSEE